MRTNAERVSERLTERLLEAERRLARLENQEVLRTLQNKGADVASASTIELGKGNLFGITGTTTIDYITTTGWTSGSVVRLQFASALTLTHEAASPASTSAAFSFPLGADRAVYAGEIVTLLYDGTSWTPLATAVMDREISTWATAVSAGMNLPFLRGFWPFSSMGGGAGNTDMLADVSGNGLHLTRNSGATFGQFSGTYAPVVLFDGVTGRFTHTDDAAFDISGTESYVAAAHQGLTFGCWVQPISAAGSNEYVIGKWGSGYLLFINGAGNFRFVVNDGSSDTTIGSTAYTQDEWHFLCGRLDPSTEMKMWINEVTEDLTASVPASVNNSGANFGIGAGGSGANPFNGRVSLAFLCAGRVPDIHIDAFYRLTAPLFGIAL